MTSFATQGFSERAPFIRPRYYNPENFGGSDSRGATASLRLLNVKPSSVEKVKGVERQILDQLVNNNGYTSFLLQNVSFTDSEKTQVMHTFGDGYVNYFYGRNPRQMSLSGLLLDDIDNDWFYKFMVAYDKFLRGTSLAKNYRLIQLTLPNVVLVGTILDLSYSQDASNDSTISFSMNFLIKSMDFISSSSTKNTFNVSNNIFNQSLTPTDYVTLSKVEIDRRINTGLQNQAYQLGFDQDFIARLSSGNALTLTSSE